MTSAPLEQRGDELYSSLASVRRELLLPAQALQACGIVTHVVRLPLAFGEPLPKALSDADRIVFGKLTQFAHERDDDRYRFAAHAYLELIPRIQAEGRLVFCLCDDHFEVSAFEKFYRQVGTASRAWLVPSETLRDRLQTRTSCPVRLYPEVTESMCGTPQVPRWGMRERAAVWIARRAKVSLDPFRVKLLWFGHGSNAASVVEILPELRDLASKIPLLLVCITQPGSVLDALMTPASQTPFANLRLVLLPWSLETMQQALSACDAVVLPQRTDDPQKQAKSNNRLIDAVHAGRFVIAHAIPSYEKLADFAWVGDSIADGLRWLVSHHDEAQRRLTAGQHYVLREHSLQAVGRAWRSALELDI